MALESYQHAGFTFDLDDSGGDGEAVVLLHGFPQTKESWKKVAPALTGAGYRVLAPDQRGYSPGARPRRRRDYALDLLVGDVLALADAAGATRFHVVGHDWGGAVAWALAADHPDRVASVTSLTTPHTKAMLRSFVTSTQALHSWYMLVFQLPTLPEAMVTSRSGGARFKHSLVRSGLPEEEADHCLAMLRGGGARGAFGWYRAIPFGPPSGPGPVAVPALYVYGTGDFALGRKAADLTGRFVTGPYRYEVLDNASHWIPEEAAERVSTMVLEHLAAHPA
jgi:pimeloyl-ACP methyl ester carboxylesterase